MISIGVSVAVIKDTQILLIKREDFPVWSLPGGRVDPGESFAEAAIRETEEETGIKVHLSTLVGLYSRPDGLFGDNHVAMFYGEAVGGVLKPQLEEVVDLGFFDPQNLPEPRLWWHDQPLQDALAGIGGSVAYKQQIKSAIVPDLNQISRAELYARRDRGELPAKALVAEMCRPANEEDQTLEVGNA